ncbi:MAG: hypothetical protein ACR2MN_04700 [Acidimicrobiales bacterium]
MSVRPFAAGMGAVAVVVAAAMMGACGPPDPPLTGPGLLPVTSQRSGTMAAPAPKASGPKASGPKASTPRVSVPATAPPTTAAPAVPLGTPVDVAGPAGTLASVNATAVVDPASPAYSYDAAGPGQRFVAVKVSITDTGSTPLQENALEDTSIVVSTGAAQTPVVTEVAGCASFVGGAFDLAPNSAAADSCVTFELPTAATVKVVHFALGQDASGQGTWAAS